MAGAGCLYDDLEVELLSDEQLAKLLAPAGREVARGRARFRVVTSIRSQNTSRTMRAPYGIMLHHTGGTRHGDFPTLTKPNRDPKRSVSANDYITKDGTIYELVEHPKRAWHAGPGESNGITSGNEHFWGIEIENRGLGDDPYPRAQVEAVIWRCRERRRALGIADRKMLIRHRDWAPRRKGDTSDSFPWAEVRRRVFARTDPTDDGGGQATPALEKYNLAGIGQDPNAIARAAAVALRSVDVAAKTVRGAASVAAAADAAAVAEFRQGPRLVVVGQKAAEAVTKAGHALGTERKSDLFGAVSEAADPEVRLREVLAAALSLVRAIAEVERRDAGAAEREFRARLAANAPSLGSKLP